MKLKLLTTAAALATLSATPAFAKVDLNNAYLLSPGMSKKEVVETMGGRPRSTEFIGELEEWHYCTSNFWLGGGYKYAAGFFFEGDLYAVKEYRVPEDYDNCSRWLKGGTYSEPDIVKEYRIKYQ